MRPQSDLFECAFENENKYQAVEVDVADTRNVSYVLFIS